MKIPIEQAYTLWKNKEIIIIDIRDNHSFQANHIPNSISAYQENPLNNINKSAAIGVICYHGISSQSAALQLQSKGYKNTVSINGGFELWNSKYPEETSQQIK